MAVKPEDPAMTAYQAVRAHELMLNEAVSRFEHARLAPLIVLNGGAAVAFLTLLGALLGKESGRSPHLWLSGLATGAWVGGLLAAAWAVAAATQHQQDISRAHRLLREGLEDTLLGDKPWSKDELIAELLRGPAPAAPPKPPSRLRHPIKRVKWWWTGKGEVEEADRWASDKATRDQHRKTKRDELRRTAGQHAQRFKARWSLSVAMFVTGAALALAAIVSGQPVSDPAVVAFDRRDLRAVLDGSAQDLAALARPPTPTNIQQLKRDNARLRLRLGSNSPVSRTHDKAVQAAKTWADGGDSAPTQDFRRSSAQFIHEANRLVRSEVRVP